MASQFFGATKPKSRNGVRERRAQASTINAASLVIMKLRVALVCAPRQS